MILILDYIYIILRKHELVEIFGSLNHVSIKQLFWMIYNFPSCFFLVCLFYLSCLWIETSGVFQSLILFLGWYSWKWTRKIRKGLCGFSEVCPSHVYFSIFKKHPMSIPSLELLSMLPSFASLCVKHSELSYKVQVSLLEEVLYHDDSSESYYISCLYYCFMHIHISLEGLSSALLYPNWQR